MKEDILEYNPPPTISDTIGYLEYKKHQQEQNLVNMLGWQGQNIEEKRERISRYDDLISHLINVQREKNLNILL